MNRVAILLLALLQACAEAQPAEQYEVYWSDADSGTLITGDAKLPFRLKDVDAPETRKRNAKCEHEIGLGFEAKAFAVELTRGQTVEITRSYGKDRFGERELVDLSLAGADITQTLIASGHARAWDYDNGQRKPDWCAGHEKF